MLEISKLAISLCTVAKKEMSNHFEGYLHGHKHAGILLYCLRVLERFAVFLKRTSDILFVLRRRRRRIVVILLPATTTTYVACDSNGATLE